MALQRPWWKTRALAVACAAWGATLAWPVRANANGAFPDSLQILLPADRPSQIALATNFGLIISDDAGATWNWTCEQQETVDGTLYAVGPAPADRFYALAGSGLAYSDDSSCTWKRFRPKEPTFLLDYFPDRQDPRRVLAVGQAFGNGVAGPPQLFTSSDGGETFGDPLYTAPARSRLTGVESARSAPNTIYLALVTEDSRPQIVRSLDGGGSWTATDVDPAWGAVGIRIIEVDPIDALKVFLRLTAADGESLAVSRDGGTTVERLVHVQGGTLKAFVRLASGTILAAAAVGTTAVGFRSTDDGASFTDWPGVPHLGALGERDGILFASASNVLDPWAMGVSTDEGVTFQPLGSYASVGRLRACVRKSCAGACSYQAERGVWSAEVCAATEAPDVARPAARSTSNGCSLAKSAIDPWSGLALGLVVAALAARGASRSAHNGVPRS